MADPIRLYLDEDAQQTSLVRALQARHIDVLTAQEARMIAETDEAQLEYAAEQGRVSC